MKKLLTIAFCAVAASTMATEVECGTVGVLTFTCPQSVTQNVVAVAFDDLSSGRVSVSNLVQTVGLDAGENGVGGDELYLFDCTNYTGYVLKQNNYPTGPKFWDKLAANYTVNGTGLEVVAGTGADEKKVTAGQGFWLVRKNPTAALTVAVYGKPTSTYYTLVPGKRNLCGNPKSDAASPTFANMVEGDVILIPDSGNGTNATRYEYNGTNWMTFSSGKPAVVSTFPAMNPLAGFWYFSKSTDTAPTISWN